MKVKNHLKRFARRYVQILAAALYNCNFKGFATGKIWKGSSKGVCVPGLNCYSCPGAVASCPLGSLQAALVSSKYKFPYYVLGTLLLMGLFLGRMICGFLCPFGFLQDILAKLPTPKLKKSKVTRALSWIKYGILVVFVLIIPMVFLAPGFCKYLCPAGTLEAGIPLTLLQKSLRSMIGALFTWKVAVLIVILLLCIFIHRAFCRFLCPLGAIYSFFNPVSFFGIRVDESKCTHCDACVKNCKMDVKKVCDRECIQCGECIQHCPVNAISYGYCRLRSQVSEGSAERSRLDWNGRKGLRLGLQLGILCLGVFAIVLGIFDGGLHDVLGKAMRICYECMGIG